MDSQQVREFSDSLVKDIIAERYASIYRRLEKIFRDSILESDVKPMVDRVWQTYGGKPLEAEYKAQDRGYRMYPDGRTKPMRKVCA